MHKELTLRGEFKSGQIFFFFFVIGKVTDLDDTPDI